MSETTPTQPQPDVVIEAGDPVQTDNSGDFDLLPQDPGWRPADATDVAP